MKQVFLCNDSITGIFSAVYDAWQERNRKEVCEIAIKDRYESELFCEYKEVTQTERKAAAVEHMIVKNLGMEVYRHIYYALLSDDPGRGTAILGTILAARGMHHPEKVMEQLGNPFVEQVFELGRRVGNEAHLLTGFVRFKELEGGILFSEISPKNQVLPCLADHFQNRFPLENWIIQDRKRDVCAVHEKGKRWILAQGFSLEGRLQAETTEQKTHGMTQDERIIQDLWRAFWETISIKERHNPKCQRNHLPLRYRPYMTEFNKKTENL